MDNEHNHTFHQLPFNEDYRFLTLFELLQNVKSKENSCENLTESIQTVTSDDEFRDIIWFGIKEYFNKTNNFKVISNIHKHFKKEKFSRNTAIKVNSNINTVDVSGSKSSNIDKVFDIQSLPCSILSFLDLKSFVNCNRLNKQWLYDSYCKISIYSLNCNEKIFGDRMYNLSRFKHVLSLTVTQSLHSHIDHFASLKYFTNIAQLDIKCVDKRETIFATVINGLIKNNCGRLQTLVIRFPDDTIIEVIKSSKFAKLIKLDVHYALLDSFALYGDNTKRLERLTISNTCLTLHFWEELAGKDYNLSNTKQLTLSHNSTISINPDQDEFTYTFVSESKVISPITYDYAPCIARKLINIEELQLMGHNNWCITSILLINMCGNRLRILDVDFSDKMAGCIKASNIKCNFKNLESAKIRFWAENKNLRNLAIAEQSMHHMLTIRELADLLIWFYPQNGHCIQKNIKRFISGRRVYVKMGNESNLSNSRNSLEKYKITEPRDDLNTITDCLVRCYNSCAIDLELCFEDMFGDFITVQFPQQFSTMLISKLVPFISTIKPINDDIDCTRRIYCWRRDLFFHIMTQIISLFLIK